MSRRAKLSRLGVPILLAAALGVTVVIPASAVSAVKKFSEGLHVNSGPGVTSATLAPGVAQTLQFDLTNDPKSNQAFGSAQILLPTGFTASVPIVVNQTAYPNFHFAPNAAGTGFLLTSTGPTGSGVAPTKTISVSLSVTPTTAGCNVVWPTQIKQSNDFSGSGNDFVALNTVTTTVGTNHLVFTGQPTDTEFDKTMATVTVTAEDPCGNAVSTSGDTVTLRDDFTPSNAVTAGLTATTSSGVATFSNITFVSGQWGYLDHFTASATGFDSVTSNQFSVEQVLKACDANKTCSAAGLTNPTSDALNTIASVDAGSAGTTDTLKVSVAGDPNAQPFVATCAASVPTGAPTPNFYGTVVSLQINHRQKTVTMTLPKSYVLLQPTPNGTPFWDICLQSDSPFTDKFGHVAVTAGFLPDCPSVLPSPVTPCVLSRNKNAGNEIMKFVLPPGDPHAAWG